MTAAIAGGIAATPLPPDGDGVVAHGGAGFIDVEAGVRAGRTAVVGFARWTHTPKHAIAVDSSEYDYTVRSDDWSIGGRAHYWPSRRVRLTLGAGDTAHHAVDGNAVPPGTPDAAQPTPDYRSSSVTQRPFAQAQVAVGLVAVGTTQVELGAEVTVALGGTVIAAGLGVRL